MAHSSLGRNTSAVLPTVLLLASCSTIASVRPAAVQPGPNFGVQASISAPPGELPGWLWSFDCAEGCNHSVPGIDISYLHGKRDSTRAFEVGGGLMLPVTPYFEFYKQVGAARGFGGRVGLPITGYSEYRVYWRQDFGKNGSTASNTQFAIFSGVSPNSENHATVMSLVQSIGLVDHGPRVNTIPAFSVGVSQTWRRRYNEHESQFGLLAIASFTFIVHRKQSAKP